jgi:hypothetical protein
MFNEITMLTLLQLSGVTAGINGFFASVFAFLPNVIAFLIILLVGYLIVLGVVRVLRYGMSRANFERHIGQTRLGQAVERAGTSLTNIVVTTFKWILILIVVVYAITALGIPSLTLSMNAVLAWIPRLAAAAIIVFFGALAASWIGHTLENSLPRYGVGGGKLVGLAVELLIYGIVFNFALIQIGFAQGILFVTTTAFAWGMAAALAIGFGVALAYGLREVIPPLINGSTNIAGTLKEGQSVSIEGIPNTGGGNGGMVRGRIRSVGMFNTIIERREGGYIVVPNNLLMNKPIVVEDGSEPPRPFEQGVSDRISNIEDRYQEQRKQDQAGRSQEPQWTR